MDDCLIVAGVCAAGGGGTGDGVKAGVEAGVEADERFLTSSKDIRTKVPSVFFTKIFGCGF